MPHIVGHGGLFDGIATQATCHVYHLRYQYLRQDLTPSVIPRSVRQQRQNVTPSVIPCRVRQQRQNVTPSVFHAGCWHPERGISVGRLSVLALGLRVRNISLALTGQYCIAEGNALAYVGRGISVGRLSVLALGLRVRNIS
jgi:hypothetical protein